MPTPPAVIESGPLDGRCRSTHGGAGYASGSHWKGDVIVCGLCGIEIQNPRPQGRQRVENPRPAGILAGIRWWLGYDRYHLEPSWGNSVSGTPSAAAIEKCKNVFL